MVVAICLFNVTINDISVIYVTAQRCAGRLKKKLYLRSGSKRYRHFAGFFNLPVQGPTRGHPFYTVIQRNRPNESPFTTRWGYGGCLIILTPRRPQGGKGKIKYVIHLLSYVHREKDTFFKDGGVGYGFELVLRMLACAFLNKPRNRKFINLGQNDYAVIFKNKDINMTIITYMYTNLIIIKHFCILLIILGPCRKNNR